MQSLSSPPTPASHDGTESASIHAPQTSSPGTTCQKYHRQRVFPTRNDNSTQWANEYVRSTPYPPKMVKRYDMDENTHNRVWKSNDLHRGNDKSATSETLAWSVAQKLGNPSTYRTILDNRTVTNLDEALHPISETVSTAVGSCGPPLCFDSSENIGQGVPFDLLGIGTWADEQLQEYHASSDASDGFQYTAFEL